MSGLLLLLLIPLAASNPAYYHSYGQPKAVFTAFSQPRAVSKTSTKPNAVSRSSFRNVDLPFRQAFFNTATFDLATPSDLIQQTTAQAESLKEILKTMAGIVTTTKWPMTQSILFFLPLVKYV